MSNEKTAVVIGASSGIGRVIAEDLALRGFDLIISSRDQRDLYAIANDFKIKFDINVIPKIIDLTSPYKEFDKYIKSCTKSFNNINYVFITAGSINSKDFGLHSDSQSSHLIKVNYESIIYLIAKFGQFFRKIDKGKIIVFSSIAASAPRSKNIIYSSAKAGLEVYCKGLQHYLAKTNVKIKIYKLGYVDTAMTFGMKLLFPIANPKKVSKYIISNLNKNERMKYYPSFWKYIVLIIKILPWFIYKRLSF